ncbi:MAG: LytTR family DNA-binding domain-containing protein [Bacteroidia bacterium]|nr:LytTR family DNA-binding domain-containing protein [Bacteroidia bacterium]
MKIKAVIVEDEENGLINLKNKLKKYCPQVEVIGTCLTAEEGIKTIRDLKPDLVFLDIQLGPVNGFDLLTELEPIGFHLIITTNHSDYGVEAVKANAVDYLKKPFTHTELVESVQKVIKRQSSLGDKPNRLAIPVSDGYRLVSLEEILYVSGANQRAVFTLFNGEEIDSPRLLGKITTALEKFEFHRIHRSFVVNIQYVESYSRTDGGYVIMSNGKRLPVAKGFNPPTIISI